MAATSSEPQNRSPRWLWIAILAIVAAPIVYLSISVVGAVRYAMYGTVLDMQRQVAELKSGKTNHLFLNGVRSDALLEQFRGLPEVEHVMIDYSHVTVTTMQHLGTLPNLKTVFTYSGVAGDEGLLELRNCTKLESVYFDRSLTGEGIAALHEYLPNVRVSTVHDESERPKKKPDVPGEANGEDAATQ